jgi:hypothetical protein
MAPPSSWSWKRLVEPDQGEHQHKAEFFDRLVQQEVQAPAWGLDLECVPAAALIADGMPACLVRRILAERRVDDTAEQGEQLS